MDFGINYIKIQITMLGNLSNIKMHDDIPNFFVLKFFGVNTRSFKVSNPIQVVWNTLMWVGSSWVLLEALPVLLPIFSFIKIIERSMLRAFLAFLGIQCYFYA